MIYDYYLQTDSTRGIRRFPTGDRGNGQRWDRKTQTWTNDCCDRRSCELTRDRVLTEQEVEEMK